MVQAMDDGVGRVIEALARAGLDDDTLVWFLSDNGAAQWGSNGPLRGRKGTDWEGGHRVPSIVRWPSVIASGENGSLTSTIDVMPTISALAGLRPPADRPFDGIDLGPILERGDELTDRWMFWQGGGVFWNGSAVRDGRWKLVNDRYEESPAPAQLFDLSSDLAETTDLASAHPDRVERMTAALAAWRDDIAATRTPQPTRPSGR